MVLITLFPLICHSSHGLNNTSPTYLSQTLSQQHHPQLPVTHTIVSATPSPNYPSLTTIVSATPSPITRHSHDCLSNTTPNYPSLTRLSQQHQPHLSDTRAATLISFPICPRYDAVLAAPLHTGRRQGVHAGLTKQGVQDCQGTEQGRE